MNLDLLDYLSKLKNANELSSSEFDELKTIALNGQKINKKEFEKILALKRNGAITGNEFTQMCSATVQNRSIFTPNVRVLIVVSLIGCIASLGIAISTLKNDKNQSIATPDYALNSDTEKSSESKDQIISTEEHNGPIKISNINGTEIITGTIPYWTKGEDKLAEFLDRSNQNDKTATIDVTIIGVDDESIISDGIFVKSFTIFDRCNNVVENSNKPSVFECGGTEYNISYNEDNTSAATLLRGAIHLSGKVQFGGCIGPYQGMMTCNMTTIE